MKTHTTKTQTATVESALKDTIKTKGGEYSFYDIMKWMDTVTRLLASLQKPMTKAARRDCFLYLRADAVKKLEELQTGKASASIENRVALMKKLQKLSDVWEDVASLR